MLWRMFNIQAPIFVFNVRTLFQADIIFVGPVDLVVTGLVGLADISSALVGVQGWDWVEVWILKGWLLYSTL